MTFKEWQKKNGHMFKSLLDELEAYEVYCNHEGIKPVW